MTSVALSRAAAAGPWAPRLVAVIRFVSLLYVFVVAFLVLAAVIPSVATGFRPLSVVSGSMQPAIKPGAMVLVQPAEPDRFYGPPSILAFHDAARPGRLVTHRVVGTEKDPAGGVAYTTRGDANRVADSGAVPHDQVVGAVRMVVPFVGLPQMWLHNGDLARVASLLGLSFLAVAGLLVRSRP
jgi:signal peptidase I